MLSLTTKKSIILFDIAFCTHVDGVAKGPIETFTS